MQVRDIQPSSAVVTYAIANSSVPLKNVEVQVNETDSGIVSTFISAALANGSVPIGGLKSGNDYTVRVRTIANDGRPSELTAPVSFKSGEF